MFKINFCQLEETYSVSFYWLDTFISKWWTVSEGTRFVKEMMVGVTENATILTIFSIWTYLWQLSNKSDLISTLSFNFNIYIYIYDPQLHWCTAKDSETGSHGFFGNDILHVNLFRHCNYFVWYKKYIDISILGYCKRLRWRKFNDNSNLH